MRATDLLGIPVRDSAGELVGVVVDLRLVQDGPPIGSFGAAFRVHGLVVARHGFGSYLGYDRARVSRPWLIHAVMSRLRRHARYVEWPLVASRGGEGLRLSVPRARLPGVPVV